MKDENKKKEFIVKLQDLEDEKYSCYVKVTTVYNMTEDKFNEFFNKIVETSREEFYRRGDCCILDLIRINCNENNLITNYNDLKYHTFIV